MQTINSLERLTDAVAHAQGHWRARSLAAGAGALFAQPGALTIALSREAGAPGTSVARAVGERLHWPVYDHELLDLIAKETKWRVSLLESLDEKRVSWLQECVEGFGSGPAVSQSGFVQHLATTLFSLAGHGECVIVGRGAAQILPAATTLRVRVVAALEDRIALTGQRLGVSRQEAARWVETTERERTRFVQDHFQRDPIDVDPYDLVVNASRFAVGECADLIVAGARCLQRRLVGKEAGGP